MATYLPLAPEGHVHEAGVVLEAALDDGGLPVTAEVEDARALGERG